MPSHAHILTANRRNHVIRRCTQQLSNDGELVDMVFSWEQWLALEHLSEDAAGAPDVHLNIVFLPCEHDLGGAVVASRDIAGHLRVLDTGETEVADLEVAVFVDEDVGGLEVAVYDTSGVDVFEAALRTRC